MFMSPEATSAANTCLYFINYHIDTELSGQVAYSLGEFTRQEVVAALSLNRLNYDSDDITIFFNAPLLNFGAHIFKSNSILLPVIVHIFGKRVLVARVDRRRPVKSRNINFMHGFRP